MTHKQTWLTVAEAFATPPEERTSKQSGTAHYGLCGACYPLDVDDNLWHRLSKIFPKIPPGEFNAGFWLPTSQHPLHTREHDFLRCIFAGLLAAMSKKEFEQLLESPQ